MIFGQSLQYLKYVYVKVFKRTPKGCGSELQNETMKVQKIRFLNVFKNYTMNFRRSPQE